MPLTHTATSSRRDETIGMYRVIAAAAGSGFRAGVYTGMKMVEAAEGDTIDAAFAAAAALMQARIQRLRAARRDGLPTAEEYQDALSAVPLQGSHRLRELLRIHASRAEAVATLRDLALTTGVSETDARLEYSRLGRKLAQFLGIPPDPALGRELAPLAAFADVAPGDPGPPIVRLKPAVLEALER